MGASDWHYLVPFLDSVEATLEQLRAQVFLRGEYYLNRNDPIYQMDEESFISQVVSMYAEQDRDAVLDEWRLVRDGPPPPDIESLLEEQEEEGTHSILDISQGVSTEPAFLTVSPLTSAQLIELFGSSHPDQKIVEEWALRGGVAEVRQPWSGAYIILGPPESPKNLFFVGLSGG